MKHIPTEQNIMVSEEFVQFLFMKELSQHADCPSIVTDTWIADDQEAKITIPDNVYFGLEKPNVSKHSWYEGEFQPVVGTNMIVEIDPEQNIAEIIGLSNY